MAKNKYFTVEEMLHASENQESFNASISSLNQLMLSTRVGNTLGTDDAEKVHRLINYVESTYDVRLKICGGGYGCTRLNFEVEGGDSAIDLSKKLLKDKEFRKLAKDAEIDLVITLKEKSSIGPIDDNPQDISSIKTDKQKKKRVSSDGTIQNIAGG